MATLKSCLQHLGFWAIVCYAHEKELCKQEIPVPSASTPFAQEISGISKDSLSPADKCPFPNQ
jgi:hypothetical protein